MHVPLWTPCVVSSLLLLFAPEDWPRLNGNHLYLPSCPTSPRISILKPNFICLFFQAFKQLFRGSYTLIELILWEKLVLSRRISVWVIGPVTTVVRSVIGSSGEKNQGLLHIGGWNSKAAVTGFSTDLGIQFQRILKKSSESPFHSTFPKAYSPSHNLKVFYYMNMDVRIFKCSLWPF